MPCNQIYTFLIATFFLNMFCTILTIHISLSMIVQVFHHDLIQKVFYILKNIIDLCVYNGDVSYSNCHIETIS